MQPETEKLLADIARAANFIQLETAGIDLLTYNSILSIQFSVERAFEIIGHAVREIARIEPEVAQEIDHYREIISFRNVIAHGYAELDNARVWDVITLYVPHLLTQVREILERKTGA
jgi:uncharacterized protein with HEPN domain